MHLLPNFSKGRLGYSNQSPLATIIHNEKAFDAVVMDIFGLLKKTKNHNKYKLVLKEYSTNALEAFTLRNDTTKAVLMCLLDAQHKLGNLDNYS